jgi:hypothetical protein
MMSKENFSKPIGHGPPALVPVWVSCSEHLFAIIGPFEHNLNSFVFPEFYMIRRMGRSSNGRVVRFHVVGLCAPFRGPLSPNVGRGCLPSWHGAAKFNGFSDCCGRPSHSRELYAERGKRKEEKQKYTKVWEMKPRTKPNQIKQIWKKLRSIKICRGGEKWSILKVIR